MLKTKQQSGELNLMKINLKRKLGKNYERLAYKYRHSKTNWIKNRNSTHISKSQHPSRTRQIHGENSSLEIRNNTELGFRSKIGDH